MFSPITLNLSQLVGDVQLTGVAQGNILIRGASKWNNLATGTAGYGLVSGGAGANPSWQPVVLANGVAGGQTIIGGTAAGDNLTLLSTSNVTKGQVRFGTTAAWDETTDSFNVGSLTALSNVRLYVNTGADAYKGIVVRANSGSQSANLFETQDSGGTNVLYSLTSSGAVSSQVRDSVTNALSNVLTLRHNSTGTVANNFGGRILLQAETDSQEDRNVATIDWTWADATDATRKGTCNIIVSDSSTTRTTFQGYADGTTARVGLCGGVSNSWNLFVTGSEAISLSDAGTTTQPTTLLVAHNSSGTPAAGMGVQMALAAGTDTISSRTQLTINSQWVTATDASRTARAFFYIADATSTTRECVRLESDGTVGQVAVGGAVVASAKMTVYSNSDTYNALLVKANSSGASANTLVVHNGTGSQVFAVSPAGLTACTHRSALTTAANVLYVEQRTSATPVNGFGPLLIFSADTSNNNSRSQSAWGSTWADVTDASRRGRFTLYAYDSTTRRECIRGESDGTVGQVAFGAAVLTSVKAALYTGSDSYKGLVIRSNSATQSASLLETQDSTGAVLSSIAPSGLTTFNLRDAATTTDSNALVIDHFSSGTPGVGYGSGIKFQLQSSTTVSRDNSRICGVWATATDASRKGRLVFLVSDNTTEREGLRIETDGTNALVSLTATSPPTAHLFSSGLAQPASVGTATGTAATAEVAITGGVGGSTTIATTGTGGVGGGITFTCGSGGTATAAATSATGGAGGVLTLTGGAGGAASAGATSTGGNGGAVTISGGTAGTGTTAGGTGGTAIFQGGAAAASVGSAGGGTQVLGRAGSSTGSGGAGGAVTITAGAAGGDDTVNRGGGSVTITAGASKGSSTGGAVTITTGVGGAGTGATAAAAGNLTLQAGAGGASAASGTATGGNAGTIQILGAAGGQAASAGTSSTGGSGSAITITGGAGGAAAVAGTGNNTGGQAAVMTITGGAGGAATGVTSGTNTGGGGASIIITAGAGGVASGGGTNTPGAAGGITVRGGPAAAQAAATAGGVTIIGGTASTTGAGGPGGAVALTGSNAGGDNTASQAGGTVTITGGTSRGSSAGGAITIVAGAGGVGTGTTGATGGAVNIRGGLGGDGSVTDGVGGAIVFQTADTLTLTTRLTITANGVSQFVGGATPTGNTAVQINVGADANVGLTIIANSATQTAELIRVRNSASTTLWQVAASGLMSTWIQDAATNTTPTIAQFIHGTSGTAAAGFGSNISLEAFSDSGAQRAQMSLTSSWVVATDGSRTSRGVINAHDSTATRECIRIEASGTAAMIGVLGASAIARYNTTGTTTGFTAGAGTNVTDQSTFTGNTGATAYTIGDIVRALKQYGWLTS